MTQGPYAGVIPGQSRRLRLVAPWRDLDDRIVLFSTVHQRNIELLGGGVHVFRLLAEWQAFDEIDVLNEVERGFPDDPSAPREAAELIGHLVLEGVLRDADR